MKKTDELLDDFSLQNENININEVKISETEIDRIKKLTLTKAKLKRPMTRRLILPLAAAMTLILSFAVVFAQGGLSNIYYRLFGENIKYVNDMGTVIDESYSANGITFNVANMVGDENSFYIIFEVIKEGGESFKESDYIEFETLRLDFSSSGGYTWYETEDDNPNDNKATFILIGNTEKKTAGKKLSLMAENFTEYSFKEPENKLNVYDFLLNNSSYQNQELVKNNNMPYIPVDENMLEEEKEKIKYMENIVPKEVLPLNNLSIPIDDDMNSIYIDNIGFAEGRLCIRISREDYGNGSLGDFYFENKESSKETLYSSFVLSEEYDSVQYDYYIFDIKDMEMLKNYNLIYNTVNMLDTVEGKWEVSFKADYKNTTRTVYINKEVEMDGKRYVVRNLKISPLSLTVKLSNNLVDNISDRDHNLNNQVSVKMKDGSTVELSNWGTSTNPLTSTINMIFLKPVDMEQVSSVIIAGIEVNINKK